jgi:hypothetical protein
MYFFLGIPIFRRTIDCHFGKAETPSPEQIEASLPESTFQRFIFKSFDTQTLGFREEFFGRLIQMSYTPVMHGVLSLNRHNGTVTVTGYANWSTLVLALLFLHTMDQDDAWFFALALVSIIGAIYVVQAKRFAAVAETTANLTSSHT